MDIFEYWEEQNEYYDNQPIRYTVCYEGPYFAGDKDGYNFLDYNSFDEAMEMYKFLEVVGIEVELKDNWYDVTFSKGDWN